MVNNTMLYSNYFLLSIKLDITLIQKLISKSNFKNIVYIYENMDDINFGDICLFIVLDGNFSFKDDITGFVYSQYQYYISSNNQDVFNTVDNFIFKQYSKNII